MASCHQLAGRSTIRIYKGSIRARAVLLSHFRQLSRFQSNRNFHSLLASLVCNMTYVWTEIITDICHRRHLGRRDSEWSLYPTRFTQNFNQFGILNGRATLGFEWWRLGHWRAAPWDVQKHQVHIFFVKLSSTCESSLWCQALRVVLAKIKELHEHYLGSLFVNNFPCFQNQIQWMGRNHCADI